MSSWRALRRVTQAGCQVLFTSSVGIRRSTESTYSGDYKVLSLKVCLRGFRKNECQLKNISKCQQPCSESFNLSFEECISLERDQCKTLFWAAVSTSHFHTSKSSFQEVHPIEKNLSVQNACPSAIATDVKYLFHSIRQQLVHTKW